MLTKIKEAIKKVLNREKPMSTEDAIEGLRYNMHLGNHIKFFQDYVNSTSRTDLKNAAYHAVHTLNLYQKELYGAAQKDVAAFFSTLKMTVSWLTLNELIQIFPLEVGSRWNPEAHELELVIGEDSLETLLKDYPNKHIQRFLSKLAWAEVHSKG